MSTMTFAERSQKEVLERYRLSIEQRSIELPYCLACRSFFFFPRPFCPECWSEDVESRHVSGLGKVWSYAVVRTKHGSDNEWHKLIPYVVAIIELEEGIRITSNVLGIAPEQVTTGMDVQITYHDLNGTTLCAFVPLTVEKTAK